MQNASESRLQRIRMRSTAFSMAQGGTVPTGRILFILGDDVDSDPEDYIGTPNADDLRRERRAAIQWLRDSTSLKCPLRVPQVVHDYARTVSQVESEMLRMGELGIEEKTSDHAASEDEELDVESLLDCEAGEHDSDDDAAIAIAAALADDAALANFPDSPESPVDATSRYGSDDGTSEGHPASMEWTPDRAIGHEAEFDEVADSASMGASASTVHPRPLPGNEEDSFKSPKDPANGCKRKIERVLVGGGESAGDDGVSDTDSVKHRKTAEIGPEFYTPQGDNSLVNRGRTGGRTEGGRGTSIVPVDAAVTSDIVTPITTKKTRQKKTPAAKKTPAGPADASTTVKTLRARAKTATELYLAADKAADEVREKLGAVDWQHDSVFDDLGAIVDTLEQCKIELRLGGKRK